MTALVTKHLPLVVGAPDGVKKLRALILELAVRGKLVPHDPSDEPIAVLLARTAAAKAALQPRGRAKAKKSSNDLAGSHPYVIPSSWKWCCLADLVEVLNGRAYKKEELLEQGTPVLRVGNLFTSNHWYYSNLTLDEDRYCVPGDLLYAWSASFGPFIWTGERSIYHYHIWKLAPHSDADVSRRYLHDYLQAQTAAIKAAGHGVSMTHMTKEKMEQLPVPLPPLAEQHRIVAKVDELMALCDRLEADQTDAEAAHAQLVQVLLDSLTQATDAADFRASWQRLSEHFHTLFTTEASIDALKQTVLQLAVQGRLLPKTLDWQTLKLADLGKWAVGSGFPTAEQGKKDLPILFCKVSDMNLAGNERFIRNTNHTIDEETVKRLRVNVHPAGTVVFPKIGGAISTNKRRILIKPSAIDNNCLGISPADSVSSDYLYLLLTSIDFTAYQAGTSVPALSQGVIGQIFVRLPTLIEQHRIVAKVDELMALCDQLKAGLTESRQFHAQLAAVLVEQAVA